MRPLLIVCALALGGCSPGPGPAKFKLDAYPAATFELAEIDHQADEAFKNGKPDEAAALIQKGEPVSAQLMAVEHPTEAALQAASDLDDLYGRMLLSNRHYAWARMMFQKNLARWKHWNPPDEESARRLKRAQDQIAECDRHM